MALPVKSWGKARAERVAITHADLQFRGIDDPTLPKWLDAHTTDQWPVFPSYGLYFRNVDRVELRDVRTSFTGRDYRLAMAGEGPLNGKRKPATTHRKTAWLEPRCQFHSGKNDTLR